MSDGTISVYLQNKVCFTSRLQIPSCSFEPVYASTVYCPQLTKQPATLQQERLNGRFLLRLARYLPALSLLALLQPWPPVVLVIRVPGEGCRFVNLRFAANPWSWVTDSSQARNDSMSAYSLGLHLMGDEQPVLIGL